MVPANSPAPSPLNTFYALPRVTEEYVSSGEGEQVYRMLGISSHAKRLLKGKAGNGTITWEDAQSVRSSATLCACVQQHCQIFKKGCFAIAGSPLNMYMMYLFTTVPHPHGHWQLQELLGNHIYGRIYTLTIYVIYKVCIYTYQYRVDSQLLVKHTKAKNGAF